MDKDTAQKYAAGLQVVKEKFEESREASKHLIFADPSTDPKKIAEEDSKLSAQQLDDKYNSEGDGEHPLYPRSTWREAVEKQETISGYWDWVVHQLNM